MFIFEKKTELFNHKYFGNDFYCVSVVVPCLIYVNINYSINTLPSHYSIYNFSAVTIMFLHAKIGLFQLRM